MKKVFYFAMLCLYVLGIIGGVGYACYGKGYAIAVGIVAVAYMAYPKANDYFKGLTS